MSKLTKGQKNEKENLEWFGSHLNRLKAPNDEDFKEFLDKSERGIEIKPHTEVIYNSDGKVAGVKKVREGKFNYYVEAKRWRGIFCDSARDKVTGEIIHRAEYEEGILSGDMPYYVILGGCDDEPTPLSVVNYMKKSLFGGMDKELIESVYQQICQNQM